VQDAIKLFEADCARHPYVPTGELLVSPINARAQLSAFISKAKSQLLIYDPKVNDVHIVKQLNDRVAAGVDVRIIGKVGGRGHQLVHQKYPGHRLHVRAIMRDGRDAFMGSQSLRRLELDKRREVGVIVKSATIVNEMVATFEADWALTEFGREQGALRHKDAAKVVAAAATA
jgi:phosphatidylserine/phosphatidylglycerophosphate/cardiolipin synthase-like enzyme